jgi:hypothetical protein
MTAGFNDTMHASLSLAFGLVVFMAVALSAVAYQGWFRLYAIVTILILAGFGAASSVAIRGIERNFTPWAGWLRTNPRVLVLRMAGRVGPDDVSLAEPRATSALRAETAPGRVEGSARALPVSAFQGALVRARG